MAPGFRCLQLHATLAHFAIMRYWKLDHNWPPESGTASRLLTALSDEALSIRHFVMRRYAGNAAYKRLLEDLVKRTSKTTTPYTTRDLIETLQELRRYHAPADSKEKPETIYKDLTSIIWLLRRGSSPEKLRESRKSETVKIQEPDDFAPGPDFPQPELNQDPAIEFELERTPLDDLVEGLPEEGREDESNNPDDDAEDEENRPTGTSFEVSVYQRQRWKADEVDQCLSTGTHPADELLSSSIYLSHRKTGPRVASSWAARKNFMFPWSPEEIPVELLADGMQVLREAADQGRLQELELYARACVILRLGITASEVRELVVRDDQPPKVSSLTLVLQPSGSTPHGEWVVPALPLRLKGKTDPGAGYKRPEDHFLLADYTGVGKTMRRLLSLKYQDPWDGKPVQPFDQPPAKYDGQLRDCFERWSSPRPDFLRAVFTFPRLAQVRFRRVCDCARENVIPAIYLSRKEHPTGEVTRFYATLPIRCLQMLDGKSMIGLYDDLNRLGYSSKINTRMSPTHSDGYVGSPFCPTTNGLKEFFDLLRKSLGNVIAKLHVEDSPADRILRHNLFITYTYAGYNLATGHRAVVGGYSVPQQVEKRYELLGIRDKGSRGRLIPIAPSVHAQMIACADYLDTFPKIFSMDKPDLPLFLMGEDSSIHEISPTSLQDHLPYVANFGRHYLCSWISERQFAGAARIENGYLKELIGHAAEGEDRSSLHSLFDYGAYAFSMHEVLEDLLAEIEFWPIDITGTRQQAYDAELEYALAAGATWSEQA